MKLTVLAGAALLTAAASLPSSADAGGFVISVGGRNGGFTYANGVRGGVYPVGLGGPVYGGPVYGGPVYGGPVYGRPVYGRPGWGGPIYHPPVVYGRPPFYGGYPGPGWGYPRPVYYPPVYYGHPRW